MMRNYFTWFITFFCNLSKSTMLFIFLYNICRTIFAKVTLMTINNLSLFSIVSYEIYYTVPAQRSITYPKSFSVLTHYFLFSLYNTIFSGLHSSQLSGQLVSFTKIIHTFPSNLLNTSPILLEKYLDP